MNFFKKVFITASAVPAFNVWFLSLLMVIACLKSIALAWFDISATWLYIEQTQLLSIGFDFIVVSALISLIGYETHILKRRKGYGSVVVISVLLVLITGILWGVEFRWTAFFDVLFISKYLIFAVFNIVFWLIVERFIPLRPNSLKFIFILCADFLGYALAGLGLYFFSFGAYSILYIAFDLFLLFYITLYILSLFVPIAREMFVPKTGAIQDLLEQKLVRCMYLFSFFVMMSRCLMDYAFYAGLMQKFSELGILKQLAFWWGCFGGIAFLFILLLHSTRYFFILWVGTLILVFSVILAAIGVWNGCFAFIYMASLMFMVAFSLYYNDYIKALLCPLNLGCQKSINKKRLVLIEPVGFMFGAILIMHVPFFIYQGYFLFTLGAFLSVVFILSFQFYSALLLKIFRVREWRDGPLMLISFRVINYIKEHIQNTNADDAIYFLRILETSKHSLYLKNLLKALKHPSETVRLFCLNKIERLHNKLRYIKIIESIFQKDDLLSVRRKSLSLLIQIKNELNQVNGVTNYSVYLDHRTLKAGAMMGFLKIGGNHALLAMDGLQKLVVSRRMHDNLLALMIIDETPLPGLVRLLMILLKNTNTTVVSEALLVAGKIKHPECLPIILNSLNDTSLREEALIALKRYGVQAFPLIERILNNPATPSTQQKTLILFLTMLPSSEGKQILLRTLQIGNQKLRKTIIQGMIDTGIFWIHKGKYQLLKMGITKDTERILWLIDFVNKYKQAPVPEASDVFAFLIRAMNEEIDETRESVLYQLLLLNDQPVFVKAVRMLLSKKQTTYDLALGILQDMLKTDLFKMVRMVALLPVEQKKEVVSPAVSVETAVKDISNLIINPPFALIPWIRTTALYCLRRLGSKEGIPAVLSALNDKNPLVLEAAIWAFVRLEKNQEEIHRVLLRVPTSLLVTQSLEEILEN